MTKSAPFSEQVSKFDCVPVSFLNGLAALFSRDEIPPTVIQRVYLYTLDNISSRHHEGRGTTDDAVQLLCCWLGSKVDGKFRVKVEFATGSDTPKSKLDFEGRFGSDCVGLLSVFARKDRNNAHYILAFALQDDWIYGFDPYPRGNRSQDRGAVEWDVGGSFKGAFDGARPRGQAPNIRIRPKRLLSDEGRYAMGSKADRTCVWLSRATKA